MTNSELKAFVREALSPILNYRNGDTRAMMKARAVEEAVQLLDKAIDERKEEPKKASAKKK